MTIIQRSFMREELIQVEVKEYKEVKEKCGEGPWQHFPSADDLANMHVTHPGGIAFTPPPVRPSMMPHPRAPISKETIQGANAGIAQRTFLIHINLGLSLSFNGNGPWDGFDVTKDQTDEAEDRIDVIRDKFDVPRNELDVTRDELDVTRNEFDVTRDEFDVTRDEFDMIRDEFDVTIFSGTQMMQFV
ncbi:hypothetical protein CDL15_Pgr001459 [Punica granatum]|uniref:Uncharacterized protein n=1 Tax=Punica granatum TaxID=22663 RepID=A0A218WKL9_PUNGR|nr:hypothetical protein CDL15_Pgr001459 [Punica granatum]